MFQLPLSSPSAMAKPKPPVRSDSMVPNQLAGITDELRDMKRVHAQGQEEDLRMALGRTITRVEELSAMLLEQYKAQTEIQTELTLCKSNLQLALANNEMLEDALKRDTSGRGKDVGWRRQQQTDDDRSSTKSFDGDRLSIDSVVAPGTPGTPVNDNRFFKFRFGSNGRITPQPSPTQPNGVHPSHLTSASLPSLSPPRDKELEDLNSELERERKARKAIVDEKQKLEEELESLSQALFEEANKMVATERMKLADTEAELQEIRDEKEALRSALKVLETENGRYRTVLSSSAQVVRSASLRSHSRSNTLPPEGIVASSSRPSSPFLRPGSAASHRSFSSSPISRSSSPEPAFVTPGIEYESMDSPWDGARSSGLTPTEFLKLPSESSGQPPSRSLVPPSIDVPPWSAGIIADQSSATPKSSLIVQTTKSGLESGAARQDSVEMFSASPQEQEGEGDFKIPEASEL